jgi:hypothetical protein
MSQGEPFMFYTERRLVALTGLRARNLEELLQRLREVPGSSVFYHTHHLYLAHHFETPQFTNDFALWAGEALQEDSLAEKLAAIDLLAFTSIRDLREAILSTIEREVTSEKRRLRECPPGDDFFFCRSKSFIMPTGLTARDSQEFFAVLPAVSTGSLFFHFFEARLRLGRPTNDFSQWLRGCGEEDLAQAIDAQDPYRTTLDEFRDSLIALRRGDA